MKKLVFFLGLSCMAMDGFSQVGINTATPNAQLEIKSSNQVTPANTDGVLIPKIDAFPATNPTAAQNSMMVYLTATSAGKPPGFYYWDNNSATWKGFLGTIDADFYKVGTTTPPTAITDDMFHTGKVGIGTATPSDKLNVDGGNVRIGEVSTTWTSTANDRVLKFGDGNYISLGEEIADDNLSLKAKNYIFGSTYGAAFGNVGINEPAAKAKLHINASSQATPANTDGIIIPRIDAFPATNPTALQNSMLVYLTTNLGGKSPGFYYWDNATASWKGISDNTAWSLTGNAGTDPSVNFIGTTDDTDVVFHRDFIEAGRLGNDDTSFGRGSLRYNTGTRNTAFGNSAMGGFITGFNSGDFNTAVGSGALGTNTTGSSNSSLGAQSLESNKKGSSNTAIGDRAMISNTNASKNVALGETALFLQDFDNSGTAFDTNNVAVGVESLYNNKPTAITNGINNTAVGNSSLKNNKTGNDNIAIGYQSLFSNTSAKQNVAIGSSALYSNTTGYGNTAIGDQAIRNNSTGILNTAIGILALSGSVVPASNTGSENVAMGFQTLRYNTSGSFNTAIGNTSLAGNTSGNYNTCVGRESLFLNATGNNNTALGYQSLHENLGSGNIAIGYQAAYNEAGSNRLYIENSNSATPLIYGEFDNDIVKVNGKIKVNKVATVGDEMQIANSTSYIHGIGNQIFGNGGDEFLISSREGSYETAGIYGDGNAVTIWSAGDSNQGQAAALVYFLDEDSFDAANTNPYDASTIAPFEVALKSYITPAGAYFQVSDKNKKENIVKIENALDKLNQINGYTYQFKLAPAEIEKGDKPIQSSGVLAQEVEKILPQAIQKNAKGDYYVDYAAITPLLIEAIKSQSEKIKQLETTNQHILERLEKLENK